MTRLTKMLCMCAALHVAATAASARPTVVVLAQNNGTEITDFLVPYGVISSSGAAEVIAASTQPGPVDLFPGLQLIADTTVADFDRTHPEGANFVIVPAFHDPKNAAMLSWLRAQSAKGATLVSICDGALALAGTGLLDGHRATGHFYSDKQRRQEFPQVEWVTNTRFVHDGKFISSSGVSASLPTALYLVELLAGPDRARQVAQAQGVSHYGPAHDSDAFHIGAREYWIGAKSLALGWPRDVYALEIAPGVDEIGLAFAADMLTRTYRSQAVVVAPTEEVKTRHGLRVLRTEKREDLPQRAVPVYVGASTADGGLSVGEGARAPQDVLAFLTQRYGAPLSGFVATQLEYPPPAN